VSSDAEAGLAALLAMLKARDYRFITTTPATHARVMARRHCARDLRDVFGWNLPFSADVVGAQLADLLSRADALDRIGDLFKSRVRVSSLGDDLLLHSAYPTTQHDAVFFGPDSYRFCTFLQRELRKLGAREHLVDIGAGAGAGAIAAARILPQTHVTLTDINPAALRLAAVNWAAAGLGPAHFAPGDAIPDRVPGPPIDCIIANPPYIADAAHRAYRDGGAMLGGQISLNWAKLAASRLKRGGAFLLYSGTAIVGGADRLKAALADALGDFDMDYRELDPDVFGEELERDDYAEAERIAVVGLRAVKR
jgi:methylase of polypeptide subunit release factors